MTGYRQSVLITVLLAAVVSGISRPAGAAPITFFDRATYLMAAGSQTEIDFDEFPPLTIITDQYAGLGVTFTDGNDALGVGVGNSPTDDDNGGLMGALAVGPDMGITFILSEPRPSVGVSFGPTYGFLGSQVMFFSGGATVYTFDGQSAFVGIVSDDLPIDRVVIGPIAAGTEPAVFADLLFGDAPQEPTTVPEPASLLLLGSGVAALAAKRRRSHATRT